MTEVRQLIPKQEIFPAYFPATLTERARLWSLGKHEKLFSYGDSITSLFRIVRGRVSLVHYTPGGGEVVLMRIGAGEFIAECSVCSDIYTCEARADTDTLVAAVAMADFDRCLFDDAGFARAWAFDLARRLKGQFLRYERLSIRSARERVLHFLYSEAGPDGAVLLPGTYTEWAADLGLTKETLYRTLADLEAEGVVCRDHRRLQLAVPDLRLRASVRKGQ